MQTVKELYLAIFVIFFRFAQGSWARDMNAWKGVIGITVFQLSIIGTVAYLGSALAGKPIPEISRLTYTVVALGLYVANYHMLVVRRFGTDFESELDRVPKARRIRLFIGGTLVFLIAFGALLLSAKLTRSRMLNHGPVRSDGIALGLH